MIETIGKPEVMMQLASLGLLAMAFSKAVRKEVYERQRGRCAICGEHFNKLQTHHCVPHCISHDDSLENAVGVCPNGCHYKLDTLALKYGIYYPEAADYLDLLDNYDN